MTPTLLTHGNGPVLVLAHGAGAPMDSPFMDAISAALVTHKIKVVRFEFPYMHQRREDGKKRGPNPARILEAHFIDVLSQFNGPVFIGGKSMGGRMASHIADQVATAGLLCLGYPFHPPGRPEKLRTAHLAELKTPTLILHGERDPFGKPDEVREYVLSPSISIEWIPDGDHSFKPRKSSGRTLDENLCLAAQKMAAFIHNLSPK